MNSNETKFINTLGYPTKDYSLGLTTNYFCKPINHLCDTWEYTPTISLPFITKTEILKPNKVIRFIFNDDTIIKTICDDKDVFNFERSFYIAYAKYLSKNDLTPEGIEYLAQQLSYYKTIQRLVRKAIKRYELSQKALKKEQEQKEEQKRQNIQKEKKRQEKNRRKRERRIKELAEAIKAAGQE